MGLFDFLHLGTYRFEMQIQSTFIIKNHGVVITGKIDKGDIHVGDVITIKGRKYDVFMIDAVEEAGSKKPYQVSAAAEGMEVALHLSTMSVSGIKAGLFAIAR